MTANERRPAGNGAATGAGGLETESTAFGAAPWEPSAWMRQRLAERVEVAVRERAAAGGDVAVVIPLGRTGTPGSREERSCDRCSTYVPPGTELLMLVFRPEPWLHITGGLCQACWSLEAGR